MKRLPLILSAGLALGTVWAHSPGTVFVGVLVGLVGLALYTFVAAADRRFVLRVFLIGLVVRAALSFTLDGLAYLAEGESPLRHGAISASGLHVVDHTRRFVRLGDSDYYSERGYVLAQQAKGPPTRLISDYYRGIYGRHGYLLVIGAFYYVFGFSPIAVKLVNCLIGALLGPLVFCVVKTSFHPTIARWSSVSVTLFPSLVLWSATNLKEPALLVLTMLLLWCYVAMRTGVTRWRRLRCLALFLLAFVAHMTLRSSVYTVGLLLCLAAASCVNYCRKRRWGWLLALLVAVGAWGAQPLMRAGLAQAFMRHRGHVTTPGTVYQYLPQGYYAPGYLEEWRLVGRLNGAVAAHVGKAVLHYWLEPFPSRTDNVFLLVVFPQMLLWYLALPLGLVGWLAGLSRNFSQSLFLWLVMVCWTLIGALTGGNIGTAFRTRDMVTPLYLIFACAGAWACLYGSAGVGSTRLRRTPEVSYATH